MRASGPVHPGWIRLTVSPPISSMTFLQSLQSVPAGRVRATHSSLVVVYFRYTIEASVRLRLAGAGL